MSLAQRSYMLLCIVLALIAAVTNWSIHPLWIMGGLFFLTYRSI